MIKISIITVCVNPDRTQLLDIIDQLNSQSHFSLEHIIVEGTGEYNFDFLKNKYRKGINFIHLTEKDNSVYEAINKGTKEATGSLLGLLHIGDKLFKKDVLSEVSKNWSGDNSFLFGNVLFEKNNTIVRKWESKKYSKKKLSYGWMPPHTSVFIGRNLYRNFKYNENFKISGDYHFLLSILHQTKFVVEIIYINQTIVNMSVGGLSTSGGLNAILKFKEDLDIARYFFKAPLLVVILKRLTKLSQFNV